MTQTTPAAPEGAPASAALVEGFKLGMRRLAASVTVITVACEGQRNGCTATAVCSVTTEPPTLLACLNRAASSYDQIVATGTFGVNILHPGQEDIALRFASGDPGEGRFGDPGWRLGAHGVPILSTGLAHFECHLDDIRPAGTHGVLFGRVLSVGADAGAALLYSDGAFGTFAALPTDKRG